MNSKNEIKDIPNNVVTVVAIIALCAIAVTVCVCKTDHLLLETLIIVIAGLAGYKLKATIDEKTIQELKNTIEIVRKDKSL